jgi:hypothetical protein
MPKVKSRPLRALSGLSLIDSMSSSILLIFMPCHVIVYSNTLYAQTLYDVNTLRLSWQYSDSFTTTKWLRFVGCSSVGVLLWCSALPPICWASHFGPR